MRSLFPLTKKGIVVDLGTGDGRFVYQNALKNPHQFYIGIDASTNSLEKISEKIHRKSARGGVANVVFVHAAVENLPDELNGIADEVHVHFPWGSLLRIVATGDTKNLSYIRRILKQDAWLEIVLGLDCARDKIELARLNVEPLTKALVETVLIPRYKESGLDISEYGELLPSQWPSICTSWAQRLRVSKNRKLFYLIAQASI